MPAMKRILNRIMSVVDYLLIQVGAKNQVKSTW